VDSLESGLPPRESVEPIVLVVLGAEGIEGILLVCVSVEGLYACCFNLFRTLMKDRWRLRINFTSIICYARFRVLLSPQCYV
jgi:hypothetical protein